MVTVQLISRTLNHINSKAICQPCIADIQLDDFRNELVSKKLDNKFECTSCHKHFKTKVTLRNHTKICKSRDQTNHTITAEDSANLMKEMIGLMKELITKQGANSTTTINNTITNIQNNIALNDNMSSFLHENYDYISDEYILKCARKLDNGLVDFIKEIRFNPQHPENMNVKMHVKRDKTLYVYKDGA